MEDHFIKSDDNRAGCSGTMWPHTRALVRYIFIQSLLPQLLLLGTILLLGNVVLELIKRARCSPFHHLLKPFFLHRSFSLLFSLPPVLSSFFTLQTRPTEPYNVELPFPCRYCADRFLHPYRPFSCPCPLPQWLQKTTDVSTAILDSVTRILSQPDLLAPAMCCSSLILMKRTTF